MILQRVTDFGHAHQAHIHAYDIDHQWITVKDLDGNPLVIDIVGMDVCLMSMAEVCYALKDHVKVLIGCESYSPASGWPLEPIIQSVEQCATPEQVAAFAAAQQDPKDELAKRIVGDFVTFYNDY